MNAARAVLGIYVPGTTWWHRIDPGWKYLIFVAVTAPVVVWGAVPVVLAGVVVASILVASTGAPLRLAWGLPWGMAILLAILTTFHVLTGHPALAIRVVGIVLTALYASRVILLTTPLPRLVDALVTFLGPLRRVGINPERVGLAVAIFLRSVPHVAASFGEVRDAARARGVTRNPMAVVTPVVIEAVNYARTTGDALHARGLGDPDV
ncbi:MAG: energy-coupling factor transporter transmembrane component T family protein [Propioniciclava sp.]